MSISADRLEAHTAELAKLTIDAMYAEDPFWLARFGERGRAFALEDGARHVQYLATALRGRSPVTLVEYGRWLQRVLTTRGMCTRHLAENLERLARAIDAAGLDEGGEAARYLREAISGLAYSTEPARGLQAAGDEVLRRARLAQPATSAPEIAALYGFVVDAAALGSPATFVAHYRWLAGSHEGQRAADALGAIVAAMDEVDPALGEAIAPIVSAARRGDA